MRIRQDNECQRPVQILGAVFLGWHILIFLGSLRGQRGLWWRPGPSYLEPEICLFLWSGDRADRGHILLPWLPCEPRLVSLSAQQWLSIDRLDSVDRGFHVHPTTWGRQGIVRGRPTEPRSRLNWGSHLEQLQIHKAMNCYSLLTALIHGLAARRGPFWCSQLHYLELSLPWPLPHFLLLTLVHLAGQRGNSSRKDRLSILLQKGPITHSLTQCLMKGDGEQEETYLLLPHTWGLFLEAQGSGWTSAGQRARCWWKGIWV